jgi:pimeloyl-ACP methyl ester carboxylesterase
MFPRRVRELVLLSPVVSGTGPQIWATRVYYAIGGRLPTRAARIWFLSRPAVYLSDQSLLITKARQVRRQIRQADYRTAAMASPRAITEIYRSIRDTPFVSLAETVHANALIIGGEHDSLATPQVLIALHERLRSSDVHIVADAGHLWPVEAPTAAMAVISTLLRDSNRSS